MAYKLHYFDGRGAAELIRQVFVVAGQEYEDIRHSMEEWPELKQKMPFGQMPVLEVDGAQLPQSQAIYRFVARKFGLAGKTPWEEAQVDAINDQIKDFWIEIRPYIKVEHHDSENGDAEKLKNEILIPAIAKHFAIFAKILKQSKSGYLVSDSLTSADMYLSETTADRSGRMPTSLDAFPEVKAHMEKVRSNENLKKWIETRPTTPW